MNFYDEVLRELVLAMGAALFLANAFALVRRRADAQPPTRGATRGGTRGATRGATRARRPDQANDLAQAPLARTVTYMLVGLIVAIWALASIVAR